MNPLVSVAVDPDRQRLSVESNFTKSKCYYRAFRMPFKVY